MQCISQRTVLSNKRTMKMAHISQIVRPKECLKLSHVGLNQRQASGTYPRIQSKEEGKDQESIQSSAKPDPRHHMAK